MLASDAVLRYKIDWIDLIKIKYVIFPLLCMVMQQDHEKEPCSSCRLQGTSSVLGFFNTDKMPFHAYMFKKCR